LTTNFLGDQKGEGEKIPKIFEEGGTKMKIKNVSKGKQNVQDVHLIVLLKKKIPKSRY